MRLSKYLTLEEAIKSPTALRLGIDNNPNEEETKRMKHVAVNIFDKVREYIRGPLYASSFFRSKELNDAVPGSSKTSQHMLAEAVDMDADVFNVSSNVEIFYFIKDHLEFDQLIAEFPNKDGDFAWVHCSLVLPPKKNRKEVLVKLKEKYIPFSEYRVGMI